jgi:hypothetical protein
MDSVERSKQRKVLAKRLITLRKNHGSETPENRAVFRIFRSYRQAVAGTWRKMNEFHTLYSSIDINPIIKLRMMRRAGNAVRMGQMIYLYRLFFFLENSEGNRSFPRGGDLRILLSWILNRYVAMDRNKRQAIPNMEFNRLRAYLCMSSSRKTLSTFT